ncbi:MAG: DUF3795 domain-containing protein [Myxococcota bacterium]|nr:DUF3795 domain-containing protein [Myxococcota bacterium]
MKPISADKNLVAHCGLYCGACRAYLNSRCPGCHENAKASWCKVKACCAEHGYSTCVDCREFADPKLCGKFSNVFSKVFGVLFNSNRAACIEKIRTTGLEEYAVFMAEKKRPSLPRRGQPTLF